MVAQYPPEYPGSIELNPKFDAAYYNRGNARLNKDDYDGAIADYSKAIELNPKNVKAHYNRGVARNKKGD